MTLVPLKSQTPTPEDLFYENLTLGLAKVLANIPRITNITCEKRQPCEKAQITAWEQRHNVYLPGLFIFSFIKMSLLTLTFSDDMKRFYLSTDGFNFCWSYQYARKKAKTLCNLEFVIILFLNSK